MNRYHPTWVRCSGLCYGNKQPLSQSSLSPPKYISHPHSMTNLGGRGVCQGALAKLHHLVTAPRGMCVLGRSLPHSALDRTHNTLPLLHDTTRFTALLNGKGLGEMLAEAHSLRQQFMILWCCWGRYLIYFLMPSTVNTTHMLIPQKLNLMEYLDECPGPLQVQTIWFFSEELVLLC